TYDNVGKRSDVDWSGTAFSNTDTVTYGYNDRSELTSADATSDANYNFAFAFDTIGNRSSYTTYETGSSVTSAYTLNNLNQYTAITNPSQSPTYDNDGNMTQCSLGVSPETWNFTHNAENRLIETYNDTVGNKLEFDYDYMGRRVEKKVYTGTSGTSWTLSTHEKFVYDGYKCIEVLDGANSNAILQKFLWSSVDFDMPLSVYDVAATATYYYFADANKNIGQLMDSSGNTVAKYEYSPFGVQTSATGTYAATNRFCFSSEYYDSETQLVYYNYRYYSPTLGRWLSRDPIMEAGGWNLYGMIHNDLINNADLYGLVPMTKKGVAGTALTVAGGATIAGGAALGSGAIIVGTVAITAPVLIVAGAIAVVAGGALIVWDLFDSSDPEKTAKNLKDKYPTELPDESGTKPKDTSTDEIDIWEKDELGKKCP
ncbi:MAG: RHS repeat-associated core domain-containing protein, partial [Victivallaceae bacterium]|nr:RHS repeat-associated core domain-containing protein [Victivallaceae bacterium]